MLTCTNCGTANHDGAKFCVSCGNNMEKAYAQKVTQPVVHRPAPQNSPECTWCRVSSGFREEEGKLDSKWGATAHKVRIYICNNCGYSHLFSLGRTIWDFD